MNSKDKWFDACEASIPEDHMIGGDPGVQMILTPCRVECSRFKLRDGRMALLVSRDLLVLQQGSWLGQSALWRRWDFERYVVRPWMGGRLFEVTTDHLDGRIDFVFTTREPAEALGSYLADG